MATIYFDKTGAPMDKSAWEEKRADDEYRTIRAFDNGTIRVMIFWEGVDKMTADKYRDMWELFRADVFNYDHNNKMKADPVEHNRTFATEEEAIDWYEDFISGWTTSSVQSKRNAKGTWVEEFVEVGNTMAPPTSEELATPATEYTDENGGGAW